MTAQSSLSTNLPIRVSFYVPEKDLPRITELYSHKTLKTTVILNEQCIEGNLYLINNQVDENTARFFFKLSFQMKIENYGQRISRCPPHLRYEKKCALAPNGAIQLGQDGPYIYVVKSDRSVELRKVKDGPKRRGADHY
jgi:multidrug efflux system membrane fusion protein